MAACGPTRTRGQKRRCSAATCIGSAGRVRSPGSAVLSGLCHEAPALPVPDAAGSGDQPPVFQRLDEASDVLGDLAPWRVGKCGLKQADHLLAASGLIEDSPRGRGHWVEMMDGSGPWRGEKELIADFAGFYPGQAPEASACGASVRLRCRRLLDCVSLFRRRRSIVSAARFLRRECFPQQKGCGRHFVVAQAVACRRFGELHQTVQRLDRRHLMGEILQENFFELIRDDVRGSRV